MTAPPQTVYLVRSNRPCSGASPSALGRRLRFGYFSSETRGGRLFGFLGNFRELRYGEVRILGIRRNSLPEISTWHSQTGTGYAAPRTGRIGRATALSG